MWDSLRILGQSQLQVGGRGDRTCTEPLGVQNFTKALFRASVSGMYGQ
jgi:hypothetical protein